MTLNETQVDYVVMRLLIILTFFEEEEEEIVVYFAGKLSAGNVFDYFSLEGEF